FLYPWRFATPLGWGHQELGELPFFCRSAFLRPKNTARLSGEGAHSRHNCLVVGKPAVPVNLSELGEDVAHIIQRVGTVRVARDLNSLPGSRRNGIGSKIRFLRVLYPTVYLVHRIPG